MTVLYVDTPALAETVLAEAESAAVVSLLDGLPTSAWPTPPGPTG